MTELGELLAETLDRVRHLDRTRSEAKFHQCLEYVRREFVDAENVGDADLALLRTLGTGKTKKSDESQKRIATLGVADDVVIWSLSPNSELVVRSASGKALTAFEYPDICEVITRHEHPLTAEEKNILWPKKRGRKPRLREGNFRLWTFLLLVRAETRMFIS